MTKKLFLLPLTLSLLLGFTFHKYYVTITEAEYNAKSKTFELSIKFIGHDLEKALSEYGHPNLSLGTADENPKANEYLQAYIEKRFRLIADEKTLDFKFIGKEVNNDDFIYCYMESEQVAAPKTITIKNSLLTEVFNEQKNAVYLGVNDDKHTLNFHEGKTSETLKLSNK